MALPPRADGNDAIDRSAKRRRDVQVRIERPEGPPPKRLLPEQLPPGNPARLAESIPLLDAAALEAVRQYEYAPTLLNGVPVPVIMMITVLFSLQ